MEGRLPEKVSGFFFCKAGGNESAKLSQAGELCLRMGKHITKTGSPAEVHPAQQC